MTWLRLIPWAAAGLGLLAAGFFWWQLGAAQEKVGSLTALNDQLARTVKEKSDALNERARTDSDVSKLPPADVLNRMR